MSLTEVFSNCSDLMCPSYSLPDIPGLTRNTEAVETRSCDGHWHFWIPAFGDLCVTFRDSGETENPGRCPDTGDALTPGSSPGQALTLFRSERGLFEGLPAWE